MAVSRRIVLLACAFSFCTGAVFIVMRGPHPWGWAGFDEYYELARALARGDGYQTLDRLWGYPAFLAIFYRLFGDRPWIPLLVQVAANAAIPWMIWVEFRHRVEPRIAVVAAVLVGVLSFNTLFASTQSSDALCTVLVTGALVLYSRAQRLDRVRDAAWSGVLCGAALLFRPQFLLLPAALIALGLLPSYRMRPGSLAIMTAILATIYAPWVLWTWRMSGEFIPATTHGGVQVWYGTLQTGGYFDAFTHNPKTVFESASFDYSPSGTQPIIADAVPLECAPLPLAAATLVYWTDRDPIRQQAQPSRRDGQHVYFTLPPQPGKTAVYYYVDATFAGAGKTTRQLTPTLGAADPLVHFIDADHTGDLDRHGDLLDVFDIARLMKHVAWGDPVPFADRLDADRDGAITRRDIDDAVGMLTAARLMIGQSPPEKDVVRDLVVTREAVTLVFDDRSTLGVPRNFSGRVTDLDVAGARAGDLLRGRRSFAGRRLTSANLQPGTSAIQCLELRAGLNRIFYRREPERQARYFALAADNIRRDPAAFAYTCVRRAYRLFTITGSADRFQAVQFRGSAFVYPLLAVVSVSYFAVFIAGVVVAWNRRLDLAIPALAILYVPLTVCWFFSEMRYSLTVQPFEFLFMAVAVVAAFDAARRRQMPARV
jgi:hypothetical protein